MALPGSWAAKGEQEREACGGPDRGSFLAEVAPSTFLRCVLRQLGRNRPVLIQRKHHRKAENEDFRPWRGRSGRGPAPSNDKELAAGSPEQGVWPEMLLSTPLPLLPPCKGYIPRAATQISQLEFPLSCPCLGVCGWSPRPQTPLSPAHLPTPAPLPSFHSFWRHRTRWIWDLQDQGSQPERVRVSPELLQPD